MAEDAGSRRAANPTKSTPEAEDRARAEDAGSRTADKPMMASRESGERARPENAVSRGVPRPTKASWEAIVSAVVAVGTLAFGVITWIDSRMHVKLADHAEEKVVIVAAPAPTPTPSPVAPPAIALRPAPAVAPVVAPSSGMALETEVAGDPMHSPHAMTLSNGQSFYYYRNFGLDSTHAGVRRAVVVVPNCTPGNHGNLFRGVLEQARLTGHSDDTLVLIPIFQIAKDRLRPGEPIWTIGWESGAQSLGDDSISSGRVIDDILVQVARKGHFPDLKEVVLVGLGGAGVFVNRYIAGGDDLPGVNLTHLIVNASSYLYLDALRPVSGSEKFAIPDVTAFPDSNHYRYGLERRNPYLRRLSQDVLRRNMHSRRAIYLVGTTEPKDAPAPTAGEQLQGATRQERGANYWRYIQRSPDWAKNVEFRTLDGPAHFSLSSAECKPLIELVFGSDRTR